MALWRDVGLGLGRAHVDADAAAGAVVGRHLDREPVIGQVLGAERLVQEVRRGVGDRVGVEDLHADGGVGAHDGALAAVDADVGIPDRDLLGDGPLLVPGRARGEGPVGREGADREQVALAGHQHGRDLLDELGCVGRDDRAPSSARRRPASGTSTRCRSPDGLVDGREVAFDHRPAAAPVGLLDRRLDAWRSPRRPAARRRVGRSRAA